MATRRISVFFAIIIIAIFIALIWYVAKKPSANSTVTQATDQSNSTNKHKNATDYCTGGNGAPHNDLNGDGTSDVLAYNPVDGTTRLDLYRSDGFAKNQWQSTWELGWCHYFGYFNADTRADKLSYDPINGKVAMMVVINDRADLNTAWTVENWPKGRNLVVGDYNGDGQDDVLAYNPRNGEATMYTANNDSEMKKAWEDTWAPNWSLYAGDLNGDKRADMIAYNKSSGHTRIDYYTEAGLPENKLQLKWDSGWELYLGDYNGNGVTDILAYNPANGKANVSLKLLNDPVEFEHSPSDYWPHEWSLGWKIITGDFNADKVTDMISYNPDTGEARLELFSKDTSAPNTTAWREAWAIGWQINR